MTLELSVAQLNFTVGDMAGNAQKIVDAARRAYAKGVRLLITPELSICGYAAEDLFLRASFISACEQALDSIRLSLSDLRGMHVVVGHPSGHDERTRSVAVSLRFNMASVMCEGKVVASYAKREL
ncbi:MAG: NAD+ synthase, partial [Betaproteobacteria bacterium]|nr:NAD+ synthase [Betaproteobacteria bacterium]